MQLQRTMRPSRSQPKWKPVSTSTVEGAHSSMRETYLNVRCRACTCTCGCSSSSSSSYGVGNVHSNSDRLRRTVIRVRAARNRDISRSSRRRGRRRGRRIDRLRDALVAHRRDAREVGLDPEHRVERVRLPARLRRDRIGGCGCRRAGLLREVVCVAEVDELVAHELRDDVDVLCGAWTVESVVLESCAIRKGSSPWS